MSESFEDAMTVFRENLAGMYDNGHMTKWADVDTSVDLDRLQEAHDNEIEQARDPQRIGGMLDRGSFEYALEQLREFRWQHATNDEDAIPYINNVARAHEQAVKSEYHRGYEDGRHSMDAEHYAVALRLRALPLDGGTTENLSQIARAVWHSDFGWTQGACRALRDELVRLLGGVSDEPHPNLSRTSAEPDAGAIRQYDVLGNERHEVVCRLRKLCERDVNIWNIEISIALGLDLHASNGDMCDRLIYLLGGDQHG